METKIQDRQYNPSHRRHGARPRRGWAPILALACLLVAGTATAQFVDILSPNPTADPDPTMEEVIGGRFGWSLSSIPDINDDGVDDLLVGAYGEHVDTNPDNSGAAYIFDGATQNLLRQFTSPNAQDNGWFGFVVVGLPDTNGNGTGEALVTAVFESIQGNPVTSGAAYIFDGGTSELLRTLVSPNPEAGGNFGFSGARVPDVTGDGLDDFAIGAWMEDPGAAPDNAGRAYIFNSDTGALHRTLAASPEQAGQAFGGSISGVPDTNGDGLGEVLVGSALFDSGADTDSGAAYLFNGSTGAFIGSFESPNRQLTGFFGVTVSGIGDLTGDGRGELVIGAVGESLGVNLDQAGRAYIFNGVSGALERTLVSPLAQEGGSFGYWVKAIPNRTGDPAPDILVTGRDETETGSPAGAGRLHLFNGKTGEPVATFASPNEEETGRFAGRTAGVPDLNGDNRSEILAVGFFEDSFSLTDTGRVYLILSEPPDSSFFFLR